MAGSVRGGTLLASLEALRNARELQPFIVHNVRPLGKPLGRGSYGSVEELEIDGVVCAGKSIYEELVHHDNQGAQRMVDMYLRECNVLSQLRHPHIVQFLGVCFLPEARLPVLVMELLQDNLDQVLETRGNIPLPTKLSILHDVSKGLVYLHKHDPIIIHRDLTARNVLLNSAMTAKIADMGNSRIVDIPPGRLALTMTPGTPGTMVYMPPEAFGSQPHYGPGLDVFSFGQLALFTAIQVFPQDLLAPNYPDPVTGTIRGRSELERRARYIDTLHTALGSEHSLVGLIQTCLEYEPLRRPTSMQAMERLGEMRRFEGGGATTTSGTSRLELEGCVRQRDTEIEQLKKDQAQLRALCKTKDAQILTISGQLQELPLLRNELQRVQVEKSSCEAVIASKELQLADKDARLSSLQQSCVHHQAQLSALQSRNNSLQLAAARSADVAVKDEQIASLKAKMATIEKMNQTTHKLSRNALSKLALSLPLEWKDPIQLPSGVSRPQSARIGETLYIAGVESESGVYKITEVSLESGRSRFIETPVCWFGMAAVDDRLVIAGGQSHEGVSDRVWVMDTRKRTWVERFPRMPTARESPSAVGYDRRWVFLVGGWESRCVEVLDTLSQVWYKALPLPNEATRPSLAVVGDTLYVGWDHTVVGASVTELLSCAMSNEKTSQLVWHQLPLTPTGNPAITSFHDTLLSVGGEPLSLSITMYLPVAEKWIEVSKLPSPREHCMCTFITDSEKLLVVGGRSNRNIFIKSVHICVRCNVF